MRLRFLRFEVDFLSRRPHNSGVNADKLSRLTVTTTDGTPFTGEESAQLARLIHKRFGHDDEAAAEAWRRMLGNSTPTHAFMELVKHEPEVCEIIRTELAESNPLSPAVLVHRNMLGRVLGLLGGRG